MPTFNLRKPPGDDPVAIYIETKLADGSVVNRRATREDAWKHKTAFWAFLRGPVADVLLLDAETKAWVDDFAQKCAAPPYRPSEPVELAPDSFSEPQTAPPGTDLGVVDEGPLVELEVTTEEPKEPDILP